MKGSIRIGISGWRYAPWRKVFYPAGLPQRRELEYASREFGSIELNGSFYSLQTPERYASWYADTPPGFQFSVKAPRYITHIRRLREVEKPLANFLASGLFELREKLGPILWQFPPSFRYQPELLERFFRLLPRDTLAAREVARGREPRMKGRCSLEVDRKRPLRHAIEIRHDSFRDEGFIAQLRRHRVALVVADTAGRWPHLEDLTSDFVYIRLHGAEELYASGYTAQALAYWGARIRKWRHGGQPARGPRVSSRPPRPRAARDVYCYFDNDRKVKAPVDARQLEQWLLARGEEVARGDVGAADS
ncbi:MAG TPA: DUF72 domain-containing protein [Nevskia sp.]|nr:DUF72 domain-containing protein [Nevskia sp.]